MVVTISIRSEDVEVPSLSLDAPRIVLGRSRGSDVRIPDASVSARHATIRQRGAEYLLLDEGSTNGTFLDGMRLSPGAPAILGRKTAIRLGRVWLDVSLDQAVPSNNPAQLTRDIALGLIAGALEADGNPCAPRLVVRAGPGMGTELVLAELKKVYTVGRGKEADLNVQDEDASRRHVEVMRRGGEVLARDAGSKNGAQLDGKPMAPRQAVLFSPGQCLTFGATQIELVDPLTETLQKLEQEPDEVMADDEPLASNPPPAAAAKKADRASETRLDAGADAGDRPLGQLGTITSPPKNRKPRAPTKSGWGATDLLVATLALVVLGASIAGMVWLFNS